MNKTTIFVISCLVFLVSCNNSKKKDLQSLKKIQITIDWLPSAEYYGFYYAKSYGIFKKYGYDVTINNGTGASDVAAQVGMGHIPIGTSTSDNLLRLYSKGARYSALRKLFSFNPSSIVTLNNNIMSINDLKGKIIGVNINASPYLQFVSLLAQRRDIPYELKDIKEYPIGYGGAIQLLNKDVDAFLAYTTNQAIDVQLKDENYHEIYLGDNGIYSYGLVLAFANSETLKKNNLNNSDINEITKAIIEGYDKGYNDLNKSIECLKKAEPSLDEVKLREGIIKIGKLNRTVAYPHKKIDLWVDDKLITDKIRKEVLSLYKE